MIRKIFLFPVFLLAIVSLLAFTSNTDKASYTDVTEILNCRTLDTEIGSFTEMYTTKMLSDRTVWSLRYKDFTDFTPDNSKVIEIVRALDRN